MYTEAGGTLYVYLLSDHQSPIGTYKLGGGCTSGIIADNCLYLGGNYTIHVFELTTFLIEPLIPVKIIAAKQWVLKILRAGHELILGEGDGYLEVYDIRTSNKTSTH